ncbi:hypothetical protein B0H13DRAFT_1923702 [Mycena leptocephala]|nr:hypothetical protein B0H13DRAFT_1923702 [Mycena leptocephala]
MIHLLRIEPLLYRVLRLDKRRVLRAVESLRALESKLPGLVVTHVLLSMTLYHDSKGETQPKLLAMNPTIFDLVLRDYSSSPSTFSVVIPSEMRPQRLTLNNFDLNVHFSEPLFHRSPISHFSFPTISIECCGLRAVITTWLTRAESRARVEAFSYLLTRPDPRVVVTDLPYFYEGWERAWSGGDLWARVEDFLDRKRRGEIEGIRLFCLLDWILNRLFQPPTMTWMHRDEDPNRNISTTNRIPLVQFKADFPLTFPTNYPVPMRWTAPVSA